MVRDRQLRFAMTDIKPIPPVAARKPQTVTLHGEQRTDDYAWLRDKENPEVIAYLEAENAHTAAIMHDTEALQQTLYDEMLGRIKEDDSQVPARRGDWLYYSRTETGKAYPIFCRKRFDGESDEEIYFDQNEAAKPFEFYTLGALEVSPDHNFLALLVDTDGYEDFELQVKDLRTGSWLPDKMQKLGFGLAWASDNRTLLYCTTDAAKRSDQLWRHQLGDDRSADTSVYQDNDPLFNVGVARTRSGAFLVIQSGSFTTSEAWLLDAHAPAQPARLVAPRAPGVEYEVDHGGDHLYITTNRNGATNFKVMRAPVNASSAWEEWLPHHADRFVEGVDLFAEHAVVVERDAGLRSLRVIRLADGDSHSVAFEDAAYGVFPAWNPEFQTSAYRFTYSSLATPDTVYDYDLTSRTRELRKRLEVLGGFDSANYGVERIMVRARDEVSIPVSIVYRKPFVRDGQRPLVEYAYGSYGYSIEPTFSSTRISLLDRGFVYAIAHVRGGQEMGRHWYDAGKMRQKMNTFNDFIDVAEFLVREHFTASDRLAAHGGSAGGLLMGVIANQRPDLFESIVADVPFVDVVNTMLDDSIPLTAQEWEQWGNPNVAEDYAYMKSYAPYENVVAHDYPAMLAMSGVNDSRVPFWEPAKWVAKLRALGTGSAPLLLKMNMGAGHGGSSGRYERLREEAFRVAFLLRFTEPLQK